MNLAIPILEGGADPTLRQFTDGRYTDAEIVLRLGNPIQLNVDHDGDTEVLLPLHRTEAETATERGNPALHTFLLFTSSTAAPIHLGELPPQTCGPLRASMDGDWLVVASTRHNDPEHMCGGTPAAQRYRWDWDGAWFVDSEGEPVEGKAQITSSRPDHSPGL